MPRLSAHSPQTAYLRPSPKRSNPVRSLFFLLFAAVLLCSHDLFLQLDDYFLPVQTEVTLRLINGSYSRSENTVARNRMRDVSLVSGGHRLRLDTTQWSERDNETLLRLTTGAPGTYVAGVSTKARPIELTAKKFNDYLDHDGLPDMLAQRKRNGTFDQDAVESYAKHVKTLFQVGDTRTDDWQTVLGYPIEFVPLANPYALAPGATLPVRLLFNGRPLADQAVYLGVPEASHGHEHGHSHADEDAHSHGATTAFRTDARGEVQVEFPAAGNYFLRTIYMTTTDKPGLTHESNWATLTFAVGDETATAGAHSHTDGTSHTHSDAHTHDGTTHTHGEPHTHADGTTHTHDEAHSHGIPGYAYGIASLLLVGLLFLYFNRRT